MSKTTLRLEDHWRRPSVRADLVNVPCGRCGTTAMQLHISTASVILRSRHHGEEHYNMWALRDLVLECIRLGGLRPREVAGWLEGMEGE